MSFAIKKGFASYDHGLITFTPSMKHGKAFGYHANYTNNQAPQSSPTVPFKDCYLRTYF